MTTSATLRRAQPTDIEQLQRLFCRSYGTLLVGHYAQADLARVLPIITQPQISLLRSSTFYVVAQNDTLAACGGWTLAKPGTHELAAGVGHIRHIATDPDCLRRGFAASILQRCRSDAQAAGLHTLSCWSTLQAVPFYTSQGFEARCQVDVLLTPETPLAAVEMICNLDPKPGDDR